MSKLNDSGRRRNVARKLLPDLPIGTPSQNVDFALNAADRGFVPFPLGVNSAEPAFPEGDAFASSNKAILRDWWDENPKYNVGLSLENVLTICITERCSPTTLKHFAQLLQENNTPKAATTHRGALDDGDSVEICMHFLLPAGVTVEARSDVLFEGIDVLSSDDFVVGPGSVIDGRAWTFFNDNKLSSASPWLLKACGVQLADHEEIEPLAATAVKPVAPSTVKEAAPEAALPAATQSEAAPPSIVAKEAAAPEAATPKPEAAPPAVGPKEAAARDAAARGFDVFQIRPYVHPGEGATKEQLELAVKAAKAPLVKHWQTLATQDPQQFKTWWAKCPDANLAMTTDRFIVVDIDPRNGGTDTFEMLQMVHDFPNTLTSRTQSGGQHRFFVLPQGVRVKGGTHKLGLGVDIKSGGGYVVLPGSTMAGRAYTWAFDRPIAFAPPWLVDLCNTARPRTEAAGKRIVEEDEIAIELAINWMRSCAPTAEYGNIDDTMFKVATKSFDFGVSLDTAIEITQEWNETKSDPPGDSDRLLVVVESAMVNRDNAIGCSHPLAPGFEAVEIDETKAPMPGSVPGITKSTPAKEKAPPIKAVSLAPFDPDAIPPHRWVIPGFACRGLVNTLVGPGGVSKSTLLLMMAIATVAGRNDICGFDIIEPGPVWLWNNEDDLQELQRRIASIMQAFNVSWDDMRGADGEVRLYVSSGVDRPLILATRKGDWGIVEGTPQVDEIIAEVKARGIVAFIADPLIEFHEADENNNVHMKAVLGQFRRIAHLGDCAAIVAAHTRKPPQASSDGFAGDMDSMRGGGSQVAAVRIGATLFSMSPKDAKGYVLPAGTTHHNFVRLDIGKINIGLKPKEPKWYRRDETKVGSPDKDGNVEGIGILRHVTLPGAKAQAANRSTGTMHLPSLLAEIIATKWSRETHLKVADVLASATPAQQAMFGNVHNRARCIVAAFDGCEESPTEFGHVSYVSLQGKPMTVRLGRAPAMRRSVSDAADDPDSADNDACGLDVAVA